jgi:uncharacterized protein with ParB-like and HNH nuclease domain
LQNISSMKNINNGGIVQIKDEIDDYYSDDDVLYNINSWGADLSFRELITMYKEEELVKPELQRKYVWDKTEASRFIESLLLGLPVPSIFLARTNDRKKLIVDGYQRIMTVFDYERGIFSKDEKVFKLSNSDKINEKWRGKAFSELTPSEQRQIRGTTIHAIIFEQKTPKDGDTSLYQIFERINTSGQSLMPQEIRNCVYQGKFNNLLMELNKDQIWRDLFGYKQEDSRMRDIEFILRFFSLSSDSIKRSKIKQISLKKFLNDYMDDHQSKVDEILASRKKEFEETMKFIYKNIGKNAFFNISPSDPKKIIPRFHPTVFDAVSIATRHALRKNQNLQIKNLDKKQNALLNDEKFKTFSSTRTTDIEHINGRISLAVKYLYGLKYE